MHREQLIRADAKTAVAEPPGHGFEILDVVLQTIEKDEIVAGPMHLGKLQFHLSLTTFRRAYRNTPLPPLSIAAPPG
jgi:hypothetical protein